MQAVLSPSSPRDSPPSPSRSPSSSSSSSSSRLASPIRWSRRGHTPTRRISDTLPRNRSSGSRSGSHPNNSSSSSSPWSLAQRAWKTCLRQTHWLLQSYLRLSPLHRALALLACAALLTLILLTLIYSHRFFAWLAPIAKSWRQLPAGWLLVFLLVFVTAFPPIIGYSTANTIAGLVYGFPLGWPIAAAACTLGSLCAFMASRTVLSERVHRMVGSDHRFVALGQVLRREGLLYLTAIRFCPLPFSLSNGFLATIPSISPVGFAISTALSTPKLLIHIFIGSRLAILAEQGDKMSATDKAINYLGMALGGAIGLAVGLAIYRRTMARAADLARQEGPPDADADADADDDADDDAQAGFDDADGTTALLDPEDAAAVMSEDDVSLWEAQGRLEGGNTSWGVEYHDGDEERRSK
ncbi:hypothetical protein E4U55_007211 [Claviceps digitariae]|nr:hypothetical protein E4U55_007211 [Claviceps digitariae]